MLHLGGSSLCRVESLMRKGLIQHEMRKSSEWPFVGFPPNFMIYTPWNHQPLPSKHQLQDGSCYDHDSKWSCGGPLKMADNKWVFTRVISPYLEGPYFTPHSLSRPGPWKKTFERLIFPTKYVIPKSLKFSHWPSKPIYNDRRFRCGPRISFLAVRPEANCQERPWSQTTRPQSSPSKLRM